jgi:PAS domain S-box-containing protein
VGSPLGPACEVTVVVEPPAPGTATLRWLLREVSSIRGTERALRAQQRFADSVVEAAEAFILVVDAAGRVLRSNPYLHAACGHGPYDLYGRDWREALLAPEDRPAATEMMARAVQGGAGRAGMLGIVCRGGGRRVATWSARALGEDGELLLLGHDVTDLQEVQRQALHAERLAGIGQTVTALAHESRNALQRIQACVSLLGLRLAGRPAELELVGRIQQAQDDLHRLYEDVRAYAGGLKLEPAECDLARVWREAWTDAAAACGDSVARLHEDTGDTDLRVAADPFRLRQVFRNLFDNALAAAGPGAEVWVRCRPAALDGAEAVAVAVRDSGPGLSPEQRKHLFEPFYTTKPRGTGLGLALCRRLAEGHGGRLEASGGGPGAEFILTLPRRAP